MKNPRSSVSTPCSGPSRSELERRPVATSRWLPVSGRSVVELDDHSAVVAGHDPGRPGVAEVDALAGEVIGDDRGHVGVLAGGDAAADQHGDLRAQPAEHLAELQPDVPATHDDQVLGQRGELQQFHLGQVVDVVETGDGRDAGPAAQVEVDLGSDQGATVRLDPVPAAVRIGAEGGRTGDQLEPVDAGDPVDQPVSQPVDDAVHAADGGAEVHRHLAGVHAVVLGPSSRVGDGRTGAQGLGRFAAVVEAGAPDLLHFDQGDPQPLLGLGGGHARAGLAGADHDHIKFGDVTGGLVCLIVGRVVRHVLPSSIVDPVSTSQAESLIPDLLPKGCLCLDCEPKITIWYRH